MFFREQQILNLRKEVFLISPFAAAFLFTLTFHSIFSPLSFEDDHIYEKIVHPEMGYFEKYEKHEYYGSLVQFNKLYLRTGRFHPVTLTGVWLIARVTHANPVAVHIIIFLFAMTTAVLFFSVLRHLGVSVFPAVLFMFLFLTGRYDEVWWRTTGETFGMFFLLLSLFFLLLSLRENAGIINGACGIFFLFLSALCKESFIVLIPVIIAGYMMVPGKNKFILWGIIFSGLLCLAGLFLTLRGNPAMVPNGIFSFSKNLLVNNLLHLTGPWPYWLIIAAGVFIYSGKKKNVPELFLFAATMIAWILSQLFIYKDIVIFPSCRYLVPGALVVLVFAAVLLEVLKRNMPLLLYRILLGALVLFLLLNARNVFVNSYFYGSRAKAYHKMLDTVAGSRPTSLAVVVGNGECYEFFESTLVQLSRRNINVPVKYMELFEDQTAILYPDSLLITNTGAMHLQERKPATSLWEVLRNDTALNYVIFTTPAEFGQFKAKDYNKGFGKVLTFPALYYSASSLNLLHPPFAIQPATLTYTCLKK